MTQATIQMAPGDDTHLTLLMAPQSLNFCTGQDREHLLAFGRAAFEAGQSSKCLHQIAEPSAQIPEDAQIQALMRKHRIWIEHSTLFGNDEPERELRAVQAEEHQFNAFVQDLIAATQLAAAPQAVPAAVAVPDELVRVVDLKSVGDRFYRGNWVSEEGVSELIDAALAATPPAANPADGFPDGWVPCVITYEGQHPEEVAYGPQVMMDRLKKWLDRYFEMRAAPAHPAEGVPAQEFKTKVFQALGIGIACDEHVVFVNIENLLRREDCLSAIEREFFMVETPPDESEGDLEPGEECLLNWAHSPEQYVKQFAEALAATQPAAQFVDAKAMSEWLLARRSHLGSSRESAHWGEKCWDNYTLLAQYFAAQAKQGGA
ncbi:hypothetical protein [Comamonas sp.]|uniref:hypothetical protein n=1 Tax=Comamonas sp. TaxID=34028 RepID=UPI00258814A2|nr:hypothetical protein [Comamonas sp.]